ncbi:MMPL family transporter [Streptomyces sp. NPDC092296]|uniref:MMPL family transporter n=1 Tax=Streptomyces sp. NPDC092296 TaxID=3366012 RepID=UPI00380E0514
MRSLVLFCHRRSWWVISGWLLVLAALTAAGAAAGSDYRDTLKLPASDSTRAQALLTEVQGGGQGGDQERIVFSADAGTGSATVRARVEPMLAEVARLPQVAQVVSPYTEQGRAQVSPDGRTAFAVVAYGGPANDVSTDQARQLVDTVRAADGDGVRAAVVGAVAKRASPPDLGGAWIGLLAAALVLLVTFGSLFSMLLPVLTAGISVGTGLAVVGLLTHVMDMAQVSPEIAALIGLGVGVDYALFLVTRYRQGLLAGLTPVRALGEAAETSGRSVLFAGITVCVALLGMFLVRLDFLYGLAVGASVAVLLTMVAALTLLPALLRLLGDRVLSKRERRRLAAGEWADGAEGRRWGAWARGVVRRPLLPGLASLVVIVVLALPFLSMRLGISDAGVDAKGTTTRQGYDLLTEGFGPGFGGPLVVTGRADGAGAEQAVQRAAAQLAELPQVARVAPAQLLPATGGGRIAVVTVYPRSAPQDRATYDLVRTVRDRVVPAAVRGTGAELHVGGTTAANADFARAVTDRLPLFIGAVVAISFLLLMLVFRSVLIPLTAALMNLLAAGTAFGVITAVFQWGWLGGLIGVDGTGPVEPYVPVLLFAGLFGLSMDYEVFLISRIQEEWRRRGDTREAVVHGLAATGRTITAAAAIMVLVFGSFVLGGDRVVKMAGLGLAVAVLLDAVVLRTALVPAVTALLGRGNWWLPSWLDRLLPRVDVEGPGSPEEPASGSRDERVEEPAGRG